MSKYQLFVDNKLQRSVSPTSFSAAIGPFIERLLNENPNIELKLSKAGDVVKVSGSVCAVLVPSDSRSPLRPIPPPPGVRPRGGWYQPRTVLTMYGDLGIRASELGRAGENLWVYMSPTGEVLGKEKVSTHGEGLLINLMLRASPPKPPDGCGIIIAIHNKKPQGIQFL